MLRQFLGAREALHLGGLQAVRRGVFISASETYPQLNKSCLPL